MGVNLKLVLFTKFVKDIEPISAELVETVHPDILVE